MPIGIRHWRMQYGVGQGSFHAATLQARVTDGQIVEVSYVFDCGALKNFTRSPELTSRIQDFKRTIDSSRRIDILVISHFDMDHMNGVEELIDGIHVGRIYMPYIDAADLSYVIAQAASRSATTEEFSRFVENVSEVAIQGRFKDRQVTRIRRNPEPRPERRTRTEPSLGPDIGQGRTGSIDGLSGIFIRWEDGTLVQPPGIIDDNLHLEAVASGFTYWRFAF